MVIDDKNLGTFYDFAQILWRLNIIESDHSFHGDPLYQEDKYKLTFKFLKEEKQ